MNRILILIISFFALNFSLLADDISFTAKAPNKVGINQTFTVQYSVNRQGSNIKLGNYSNFKFINGPSTSSSYSSQFINGNLTQSSTFTYTYTFQATALGNYSIGGATITIDGKQYTSNSVNIEVQSEPVQTQASRRQSSAYDPWADFWGEDQGQQKQPAVNEAPKEISHEDLFVRFNINKTNVYKGEPIVANLKLYTRVDLSGIENIIYPSFNSFYAEDLETAKQINFTREIVNGQTYNVALLKSYVLYPRIAGTATIEPCEIDIQVRQASSRNFFFTQYENIKKTIKSPEIKINVKNLPQGSDIFTGGIGSFDIKLSQTHDTVNVNEAVSFTFTINGTGNFNMIESPKIVWSKEFEVYEPTVNQKTSITNQGQTGSKSWEYTVIPRYPGIYKLGKLNFQYFDLNTQQYKTLTTKDIVLAVRKDANDTQFSSKSYSYDQRKVEYIGDENIRFIKTKNIKLNKTQKPIVDNSYFFAFYIIPLTIFIILVIFLRKIIKENSDIAAMKVKKAGKTSRTKLKKARKYLVQNNHKEFYKEISSALWSYAGNRLRIDIAKLNKDIITEKMINQNIDIETINKFINIIDHCEFSNFAPNTQEHKNLENIYTDAVNIIDQLEQKIK